MHKGMWAAIAIGVVAVIALTAIAVLTSVDRDPEAHAKLYLERAHGTTYRVVSSKRDSQPHNGFPDQYEVTCAAVDGSGRDTGEQFRLTVNYDDGLAVRDGGYSWSSPYGIAEGQAFHAAAAKALDRPLSKVKLYPRTKFRNVEELTAWGPLPEDGDRAFEVDWVVFGSEKQHGGAVRAMLAAWLPRWAGARKVRLVIAFCGDRREKVDEVYNGTGYAWAENTDTLWTIELLGGAIGTATADSITAANKIRHPAQEAAAEKERSK